MVTASWYAWLALRRRVSMSAIGSVIVMAVAALSHRGFAAPGSGDLQRFVCSSDSGSGGLLPAALGDAGQLAAVRHLAQADPAQAELAVDGLGTAAALAAGVAAHLELRGAGRLDLEGCLGHRSLLLEGEAELLEQRTPLVVVRGGRDHRDVHASRAVDLVLVDLVEHHLLGQAEGVVAAAVELLAGQTAEVADPGQRQREQPVQELPHAVAAQRDVRTDRHALTQLELRDGLAGPGDLRLLAGDRGQVADGALDQLRVAGRLADAHVHDDLGQAGDLHHVGVAELLLQRGGDLLAVAGLQARTLRGPLRGGGGHQISSPDLRATRVLRCAVYVEPSERRLVTSARLKPTRVVTLPLASLSLGASTSSITLETWMAASWVTIPPVVPARPPWFTTLVCRLMRFTPSTITRSCSDSTAMTLPSAPLSLPAMTRTRSPFLMFRFFLFAMSEHLRRQRDDSHELLLAQLPADRAEDTGTARLAVGPEDDGGVLVE